MNEQPAKIPTDEQLAILDVVRQTQANITIRALAGTGKTKTLEFIERALPPQPILYLVFGKRNAEEAEGKMLSTTQVLTCNSQGARVWNAFIGRRGRPTVKKMSDRFREIVDAAGSRKRKDYWEAYGIILQGVEMAKAIGYIPSSHVMADKRLASLNDLLAVLDEEPSEFAITQIDALLNWSIGAAFDGHMDFNDQVYMPALFCDKGWPEFPLTMVDERQDLNPVNDAIIKKLVRNRRVIAVGDPNQSIYAFRGAMRDGMERFAWEFNTARATLSMSFRCPSAVVDHVRWLVPDFRPYRQGGQAQKLSRLDGIEEEATFICRNNAPLFALAMRLLYAGRSVNVTGSDIGPKLQHTLQKLGTPDLRQVQVLAAIDTWLEIRKAKGSKSADDIAQCLRVFAAQGSTLGSAIAYCKHLFEQKGRITFTTGHKAKGLEWPLVYHLDPELIDFNDTQDRNLHYVISTRSGDRLFEVSSRDIHL